MLRDVPHCKSILALGFGGLILSVVMLTWVYPSYCNRVSQVKETKVREFVEGRYGISHSSNEIFGAESGLSEEVSKAVPMPDSSAPAATVGDGAADDGDPPAPSGDTTSSQTLPPAKRR